MDLIAAGGSLLIMLFAIYILAVMTDEYFIPSLDHISHLLNLPHNVAGASLMAMGSSAPELAIALTALWLSPLKIHAQVSMIMWVAMTVAASSALLIIPALLPRQGVRADR